MDKPLKFALFGTGFWSHFQLGGWYELEGVECVAVYNRTVAKAEVFAEKYNIPNVYATPEDLVANEELDFIDICTAVETHASLTQLGAENGLDVVCQKPMAVSLVEAHDMVKTCADAGVKLFINENWRWQYPIRQLKKRLDSGAIGKPFRARVHYVNSFPVFDNQPFLKELDQFILTDIGSHILDTSRFLFGEAKTLYATTHRVHHDIKGEDVATCMMTTDRGLTVTCEMSYASLTEIERFPQTYIYIEGDKGFLELGQDYWIRETTAEGTLAKRYQPPHYDWADPAYDLVHSSIVPCQADILRGLRGESAEMTGDDNLKTVQLVFGSYHSAMTQQVVQPLALVR
ncbi:MAG: Gfo/Idh/MocA family oxidoreductase [Anaerolineae bacterium]|nr:Gfo/Idh/MocA family oxidoreductase [Anaerolineae bacterium]